MVAVAFALILGVPFVLGCILMALGIPHAAKVVVALAPVALLVVAIAAGAFWIGDIGGAVTIAIVTFAWLLGVALSRDIRRAISALARAGVSGA